MSVRNANKKYIIRFSDIQVRRPQNYCRKDKLYYMKKIRPKLYNFTESKAEAVQVCRNIKKNREKAATILCTANLKLWRRGVGAHFTASRK